MESFNPSPEHKKVEDLPKGRQGEFVDVDGGFVRKEAAEHLKYAEASAQKYNDFPRSFFSRLFRKKTPETAQSMLQWFAENEDALRKMNNDEFSRIIEDEVARPDVTVQNLENLLEWLLMEKQGFVELPKQQESMLREAIEKKKQEEATTH